MEFTNDASDIGDLTEDEIETANDLGNRVF